MELFKLFGTIAVNNADANDAIDKTTGKAEKAQERMQKAFSLVGKAAVAAATAAATGIAAITKSSLEAYGDYEQLVGGVETLFKDSADAVIEYAANAYQTAGMSANTYMETVTSFSASLLQSLDGDTEAAVEYANMAITDMSDNANKMGSSMESIQNAYQGFAKQNYTMLDNLKLGYGGTKTEMERLITDAEDLNSTFHAARDENGDLAMSYSDIVDAIHIVQTNMGITGTTAEEAATTIQGSLASVKAAWENLLTGMADNNQDFEELLNNLINTSTTLLSNVIPRIQIILQHIPALASGILGTIPPNIISALSDITSAVGIAAAAFVGLKAGMAIQGAVQAFQKAKVALALFSAQAGETTIAQAALNGTLKASEVITALLTGKMTLAELAQAALAKGQAVLNAVMSANPIAIVVMAIAALVAIFVVLWNKCDWFRNFWINLWENVKNVFSIVVDAIKTGLSNVAEFFSTIWNSVSEFVSNAWETIKSVVEVGIMFLQSIFEAAFDILTLPWQFIWENFGDEITAAWETIKNAVQSALDFISNIISTVMTTVQTTWDTVWNAISSFLTPILNKIKSAVTTVFNAIKSAITSAVNTVKSIVTTAFNAVKNAIETPLNAAKNTVSNIFNTIKTTISNVINSAKNIVSTGLNAIKGFFDKLKIKFPDIKLPHFSIKGEFSLKPPSVPHLGVDWYAQGGILEEPTIFGYNPETGRVKVGGEAGREAVAPIETLLDYIRTAVREENGGVADALTKIISMLAEYLPGMANMQLVTDTGALVGALAPQMDSKLGDINRLRERGR